MTTDEKITAPVLDGETWRYPETWSDAQRRTWEGVKGRTIAETKRADELDAARVDAASSPDALIAAARAEADEATRKRQFAERAALGDAAWRAALEQKGDRVRRILTVEGDVIVIEAMSETECDHANARAANLVTQAKGNTMGAHAAFLGAQRDAMVAKVLHPDRDRVKALTKRYPGLWGDLENARDEMIRGRRDDEGKELAP